MSSRPAIRFGLGFPEGLHSASFRVWAEGDSSVYVANRQTGKHFKASLHPLEYGYGFTEAYEGLHGKISGGRKVSTWPSEQNRLGSGLLKEAFAVVLGRFSLGLPPPPKTPDEAEVVRRSLVKVDWLTDIPPVDQAWQFTVLITDPGVKSTPPGRRAMSAIPVGRLDLPNGGEVWVMRHLIPVSDSMIENLTKAGQATVDALGKPDDHSLYKAETFVVEESGLRALVDLSITIKASERVMNRELARAGLDEA